MAIRVVKESRSNNYKENTMLGFAAVQHAIELLFSTAGGSMPYALGYGFELKDLLFKESGSESESRTMANFNKQIRALANDEDIVVDFSRDGVVINLLITYSYNRETMTATIPVADIGNDNYRLNFDEITVK